MIGGSKNAIKNKLNRKINKIYKRQNNENIASVFKTHYYKQSRLANWLRSL